MVLIAIKQQMVEPVGQKYQDGQLQFREIIYTPISIIYNGGMGAVNYYLPAMVVCIILLMEVPIMLTEIKD